jgi:hypothetical protein
MKLSPEESIQRRAWRWEAMGRVCAWVVLIPPSESLHQVAFKFEQQKKLAWERNVKCLLSSLSNDNI